MTNLMGYVSQRELRELVDGSRTLQLYEHLRKQLRNIVDAGCWHEPGRYAVCVEHEIKLRWGEKAVAQCLGPREAKRLKAMLPVRDLTCLWLDKHRLSPTDKQLIADITEVRQETIRWYLTLVEQYRALVALRQSVRQCLEFGGSVQPGPIDFELRTLCRTDWSTKNVRQVVPSDRYEMLCAELPTTTWRHLIITDTATGQKVGWHAGSDAAGVDADDDSSGYAS